MIDDNLREQLGRLPQLLGAHVMISVLALTLGVAISLPLGLTVARSSRWRGLAVGFAGVIQTIPSLALLALMVPVLGAFGFWPALCALVLYSMLPVLRNTVVGLTGIDDAVLEAATGLGMTPRQVLYKVELPLALPVIVAGIRTSAVWVVGIATLSTPVGQPSLGNYIFSGLQTRNWVAVLVGCGAAAGLALALDTLLAALEHAVRNSRRLLSGLIVASLVASSALGAIAAGSSATPVHTAAEASVVRIGAKTFTEQYVLATLIERRLNQRGLRTARTDSLGSTVAFDALCRGELDVYVDYTGTIYTNYMKREDTASSDVILQRTRSWLRRQHGVELLGRLGFENAYALALRSDRASQLSATSITDLVPHAAQLTIGGDYEFFQRPEYQSLLSTYGIQFERKVSFDSSFMYAAVRDGEVDLIAAFSSDGRIAAFDLRVLEDPRHALPPYDAVILLSPQASSKPEIAAALSPLLDAIDVESMRQANWMVDRDSDKRTVTEAAIWLEQRIEAP